MYGIGRVHAQHMSDEERAQDERGDGSGLVGEALDEQRPPLPTGGAVEFPRKW